jgi:protein-disulfide isomerase
MPAKSKTSSKLKDKSMLEKLVPVLLVLSILLAFAVGVLWQKISSLEKGETAGNNAGAAATPVADPNGKLNNDQAAKIPEVTDTDHIVGSTDAKVFLIEYSDLECPYCKKFQDTAHQVYDAYNGDVAWVYRQFPLDLLHSKARTEAQAAECAAEQGGNEGFFNFIDKVYEVTPSNNGLDLAQLPKIADQVGLDGTALQSCIDSGKYKDKVEAEYQGGLTAGVSGTPANFIVNSKGEAWLIPGAASFDSVKAIIDEALK